MSSSSSSTIELAILKSELCTGSKEKKVYIQEIPGGVLFRSERLNDVINWVDEEGMRRTKLATLVVIGDIGRSPRMCYHALSLASKNYQVQLVGYAHSQPHSSIVDNPKIGIVPLPSPPLFFIRLPSALAMVMKFIWTLLVLWFTLMFRIRFPVLILMQNPPGVPAMLVCWMIARLKCSHFAIDWHNYTWTVLRETYGIHELRLKKFIDDFSSSNRSEIHEMDDASVLTTLGTGINRGRRLNKEERIAAATTTKRKKKEEKKKGVSLLQYYIELTYRWEGWFGRRANWNLCVTKAMREDLLQCWNVHAATFYDRPPSSKFRRLSVEDRHELYWRLSAHVGFEVFRDTNRSHHTDPDRASLSSSVEVTRFSLRDGEDGVKLRPNRPLILISSTSWTQDEDFSILLDALVKFDRVAQVTHTQNPSSRVPRIVAIITGRGPEKEFYLGKIGHMQLQNVEIITPWLMAEDYPLLMASADLGVSLHTSTSGLDLPMKVVDMFGCGVPVLAKRFACIGELVQDGVNGRLFDTSAELADLLISSVAGFPNHAKVLHAMVENLENQPLDSWEENWDACVFPLIRTFGRSTKSERRRTRHSSCSSGRPVEEAVMNNSKEDRDSGDEQDEQQAMVMMDLDGETR